LEKIEELKERLTYPKYIEYIKYHGKLLLHEVIIFPNDKYSEPVLIEYLGVYFIFYEVFENFQELVRYYDEYNFNSEFEARSRYTSMLVELQNSNV
jgi:hypothetical protein